MPELTTATVVAAHLTMDPTDGAVLAKLEATVAAVNVAVDRMATTPEAMRVLGATMLAARLYKRRNSADGVAVFTAEGAAYVRRNDPDVAMLLGIGDYAPPVVG